MISLTRLSGAELVLNSDLIERVDKTPDTVITLTTGAKYVVSESLRAVVAAIRLHRAEIIALSELVRVGPDADDTAHPADDARERPLATVTAHPAVATATATAGEEG
ncbi:MULTISPECIES: flagellar FlbD family protein [unclassified Nocardioides]|uniref:flagellar FlbD family protein n=1 Tax=unclassified Nocardioides TaxID=2615069 RepID=UPI00266660B8|nr:flagellar FlbD family protein [Nocardioides sp. Arc9.136]WKN47607.1 flagellar FlbD family protein [Nocardioides sp. Arc9.136]